MRRLFYAATALTLGFATPALGQDRGTFDIGIYGRYTNPDTDVQVENAIGFGGRLGLFLLRNVALEFDYSNVNADAKNPANPDTKLTPYSLRAAWHIPMGSKWATILGAGMVWDRYERSGGTIVDNGFSLDLGLQRRFNDRAGLRLDLIGDAVMDPELGAPGNDKTGNIHVDAGFNFRFGRESGPKDADKDGVSDALDTCPGTPAGEMVDARGCVPPKDADRDGVIDAADRCANTPVGTPVDANGCPRDSDSDGVIDSADRCANTPAGTRVDATGCPVPVDSDGDGVMDNVDACANTPAGTRVDARGCPIPVDTDGDGVVDGSDACPNTAAGTRVDARGCAMIFEAGKTNIVLEGVTFATGSSRLTPEAMAVLDKVAASLVEAADVNVEVQGHTDNTGARATNVRLSAARAQSVRAYLITKGVAATRMTSRGYGPDQPAAPNTSAEGRAQNRRVELKRTN